ncbi:MAG: ATP-binding protein [Streptosporangiales bacterium]|nr:ATP-binding protein [Streptosporangiales bacterium]
MELAKPAHLFDRTWEWQALASFAARSGPRAKLGVVSGRRRQGKSFLLQALAEETGGLYFQATEAAEAESLRQFTEALTRHSRQVIDPPFRDWNDAVRYLFSQYTDEPTLVVIDEFPFLTRLSPSLPSIIQRELGPGGSGQHSAVRLILCGSAMSVMGGLLAGRAPLRGRAGLELVLQPFPYPEAADFWGIDDPHLAMKVHMVVGGTPAYRHEFVDGDVPAGPDDFDSWITRTALNPASPLFREARYLLAEETDIREPAIYHSALAAIAFGHTTNGAIANYLGRKSDQVTHPLTVLEDSALIAKEPDLFRDGRFSYRITEPLITFYEAIMRRRWADLELRRADAVWNSARSTFRTQVAGPHFEALCRFYATLHGTELFGEPTEIGSGSVNDPAGKSQLQIDVGALAMPSPDGRRRIASLGEATWGETMTLHHLERLERAAALLAARKFDTRDTILACYSAAGFDENLRERAARDPRVRLIGAADLYREPQATGNGG